MHHAHLRYTPQADYDLSGLVLSLNPSKYVISFETGSQTHKEHYHMFFELEACEKTVRNQVLKYLKIPKSTRGKNSEYYCLKYDAYKDPSPCYLFKERDGGIVKASRGYPDAEIEALRDYAAVRWPKAQAPVQAQTRIFLESATTPQTKTQTEWQKLYCAALDRKNYKLMSMKDWARFIKHHYLKDERPIPRAGDIQRYSYSLYAILQEKTDYSDIRELDELEESLN